MAMTESTMLELGTQAPNFDLISTEGETVSLSDFKEAKALVVMFICNHCPYVIHIAPALATIAKEYREQGVAFVAINSNDTQAYPADSLEKMVEEKAARQYVFPYLFDESQKVAHAYTAACTPDFFVFDKEQKLYYRGQFDDTRPHRISSGNYDSTKTPPTGADLKEALEILLASKNYDKTQYPSLGCNIKWRPGNEPSYFG